MRSAVLVTVVAALLPCACFAGPRKTAPLTASLDPPTLAMHAAAAKEEEATLPDAPATPALTVSTKVASRRTTPRLSLARPEFAQTVSPLYSVPLVNAAIRLGGHNFNTDDGSSINAFAICYRLNRRSSLQLIPGDPAPVKLPVSTVRNNAGVTIGMVYRLTRRP